MSTTWKWTSKTPDLSEFFNGYTYCIIYNNKNTIIFSDIKLNNVIKPEILDISKNTNNQIINQRRSHLTTFIKSHNSNKLLEILDKHNVCYIAYTRTNTSDKYIYTTAHV